MEMQHDNNCHVYSNPNYSNPLPAASAAASNLPTMQIGGLPFYLPQQQPEPETYNNDDLANVTKETSIDDGKQDFSRRLVLRVPGGGIK